MRISALVVTKNRPQFRDWWAWNIKKQTRFPDQLVVVDSTGYADEQKLIGASHSIKDEFRGIVEHVEVINLPESAVTGEARQAALERARSDVITWWDDDDWYHPKRLEATERAFIFDTMNFVSFPTCWHLVLSEMRMIKVDSILDITTIAGCGIQTDLAQRFEFEPVATSEDVQWMRELSDHLDDSNRDTFRDWRWEMPSIVMLHDTNTFEMKGYRENLSQWESRPFGDMDFRWLRRNEIPRKEWGELKRRVRRLHEEMKP